MNKLFQILLMLFVSSFLFSCEDSNKELKNDHNSPAEGFLQHNVYFYLNDSVSKTDKKEFEKELQKLLSIDVIHKSEIGKTAATKAREVTDHEFDYSIFTWFQSMEDYEIYADHPDHMEFIETNKHLWKDVKVFDSQISKNSDK